VIEYDPEARKRLEEYLSQVRAALRGCRSVDAAHVERDVWDHVEGELADVVEPVTPERLEHVLERLGSPAQWVPEEDRAWWWRVLSRLRDGPEDFRLAYLTFGLFVLAVVMWGFSDFVGAVVGLASFLLARSVVSLSGEQGHTHAERWLFYPPLLCVYVPAVAFFLIWSSVPLGIWVFDELENLYRYKLVVAGIRGEAALAVLSCYAAAAITGIWWMAAGRLGWRWPRLFDLLLAPFATGDRVKRVGKSLFFVGLGLLVVAGGVLAYVLATRPIATILVCQ